MKFKKFREDVKTPAKSHLPSCGLDIFMPDEFDIMPFETKTVGLGFGVTIPEGWCGILIPRSSIAAKGLIIPHSAIDPDYRGELHGIITNCSNTTQHVSVGQRLMSLVCFPCMNPFLEEVEFFPDETERGTNGLGSSGK